jgi:hypothetical protein
MHVGCDPFPEGSFGDRKVGTRLEVHPELRAVPEVTPKAQGRLRGDAALGVEDRDDPPGRLA